MSLYRNRNHSTAPEVMCLGMGLLVLILLRMKTKNWLLLTKRIAQNQQQNKAMVSTRWSNEPHNQMIPSFTSWTFWKQSTNFNPSPTTAETSLPQYIRWSAKAVMWLVRNGAYFEHLYYTNWKLHAIFNFGTVYFDAERYSLGAQHTSCNNPSIFFF